MYRDGHICNNTYTLTQSDSNTYFQCLLEAVHCVSIETNVNRYIADCVAIMCDLFLIEHVPIDIELWLNKRRTKPYRKCQDYMHVIGL